MLAAEIILKPQSEAAEKEISDPDAPGVEAKRQKTQENPEKKKIPVAESSSKAGKTKLQKNLENKTSRAAEEQRGNGERKKFHLRGIEMDWRAGSKPREKENVGEKFLEFPEKLGLHLCRCPRPATIPGAIKKKVKNQRASFCSGGGKGKEKNQFKKRKTQF